MTTPRIGKAERKTSETDISIICNLDGKGDANISTGLGFFDHMLEQIARHALIDLEIKTVGDLHVDEHHTVEDTALTLGTALSEALGERKGIRRFSTLLPMDEALAEVAIDLGGRPFIVFNAEFNREMVGDFPTEMVEHFFRSLAESLRANIHINLRYGKNDHHKIEGIFKAFAKALRFSIENDPRMEGMSPSTKGVI